MDLFDLDEFPSSEVIRPAYKGLLTIYIIVNAIFILGVIVLYGVIGIFLALVQAILALISAYLFKMIVQSYLFVLESIDFEEEKTEGGESENLPQSPPLQSD